MKLLIVDDIETNRKVLRVAFEAYGHITLEAADGIEALQILGREPVDAVLSDILMPRMDGYRLCHEIRTSERLRALPIVIYTATYTSASDEKLALSLGADIYLKKPAPFQTVLKALREAIVAPHTVRPPDAWQEVEVLKEYSDRLLTKLEEKNIELAEANERLTILNVAKNEFLRVISHELRTPLVGLLGVSDLILAEQPATVAGQKLRRMFDQSRSRLLSILEDVLLLTEIDVGGGQFSSTPVSLGVALTAAMQGAAAFAESRQVSFAAPALQSGLVVGNDGLLARALRSLLETAVKFSATGTTVEVACEIAADMTTVVIESQGLTTTNAAMERFFDVFAIGDPLTPGGDFGFGAAVAYRILALSGAAVSIANREPPGIRLTVTLKNAPPGNSPV